MKTLIAFGLMFAVSHARADHASVTGKYIVEAYSSQPCDPASNEPPSPLGEVYLPKAGRSGASWIVSSCAILQSLQQCESQSGQVTSDDESPYFVAKFACKSL